MSARNGNGDGRIHIVGDTPDKAEKRRRARQLNVGDAEDWFVKKNEEIYEYYRDHGSLILQSMLQGAFAAYDRGRRETFDEIMADFRPLFRREGGGEALTLDVTTELLLDRLQRVFGMPKPEPEAPAVDFAKVSDELTPADMAKGADAMIERVNTMRGVDRAKEMGEG